MQRFNFDVLHIDGEKSVEADALSRLVSLPARETSDVRLCSLEQTKMIESKRHLPKKMYKKVQQGHNTTIWQLLMRCVLVAPFCISSWVNDVGTRSSRFARNYITLSSGAQKIVIERLERLDLKWSGMRKDASTFIHSCCPCCQKKSKLNRSHKQCHLRYACYTRK